MKNKIHPHEINKKLDWLIVVCRYERPLDWIKRIRIPYAVYEKKYIPSEFYVPVNKGSEASAYLKFCIDYYDRLPKRTIFLHDHEFSHHHYGSIVDRIKEQIPIKPKLHNLNKNILGLIKTRYDWNVIEKWYNTYLAKELGPHEIHGDWTNGQIGSGQYIVHRKIIRKRSKQFYIDLYQWITTTEIDNYWSGRWLEWTWMLIWSKNKVIK